MPSAPITQKRKKLKKRTKQLPAEWLDALVCDAHVCQFGRRRENRAPQISMRAKIIKTNHNLIFVSRRVSPGLPFEKLYSRRSNGQSENSSRENEMSFGCGRACAVPVKCVCIISIEMQTTPATQGTRMCQRKRRKRNKRRVKRWIETKTLQLNRRQFAKHPPSLWNAAVRREHVRMK